MLANVKFLVFVVWSMVLSMSHCVYRPTDENDEYAGVFGDNGAENVNKKEEKIMSFKMTQNQYTSLYGPTVGDSIRLGDTNLICSNRKRLCGLW